MRALDGLSLAIELAASLCCDTALVEITDRLEVTGELHEHPARSARGTGRTGCFTWFDTRCERCSKRKTILAGPILQELAIRSTRFTDESPRRLLALVESVQDRAPQPGATSSRARRRSRRHRAGKGLLAHAHLPRQRVITLLNLSAHTVKRDPREALMLANRALAEGEALPLAVALVIGNAADALEAVSCAARERPSETSGSVSLWPRAAASRRKRRSAEPELIGPAR